MVEIFACWSVRHVTDDELVCWLDSELPAARARRVAHHLEHCQKCQCRMDELQRSLGLLQEHQAALRDPCPGLPANLTGRFEARLHDALYELESGPQRSVGARTPRRLAWAVVCCSACLTFAAALPNDAMHVRSVFHQAWDALLPPASNAQTTAIRRRTSPATPAVSAQKPPTKSVAGGVVAPSHRRRLTPSLLEQESAEIEARYAMHRVHACMGEQIDYKQDAAGYAVLNGIVDTEARKQELTEAAATVRWLHTHIQTVEEAMSEAVQRDAVHSSPATHVPSEQPGASNSEKPRLKIPDDFPRERMLDISRVAVADSTLIMRHAWAMRRLASAFPVRRLERVPPELRQKLRTMLLDHATEWRQVVTALGKNVEPILKLQNAPVRNENAEETIRSVSDLFDRAEELNRLTRVLFADSNDVPVDAAKAVSRFQLVLSTLETALEPSGIAVLFPDRIQTAGTRRAAVPER